MYWLLFYMSHDHDVHSDLENLLDEGLILRDLNERC